MSAPGRRLILEDFDAPAPRPDRAAAPPPSASGVGMPGAPEVPSTAGDPLAELDLDRVRADAFEGGYKSGWDDSHAEQMRSREAISSDLEQALRDLSFTHEEVRAEMLRGLRPFFDALIGQLFPALAAEGLGALVASELDAALHHATDMQLRILAAPEAVPKIEALVERMSGDLVTVQPERAFTGAQVSLRLGPESREIDLGAAIDRISTELRHFADSLAEAPAPQVARSGGSR